MRFVWRGRARFAWLTEWPSSFTRHFSRFRGAVPKRLHFAAHSHHPWPDVTFAAQEQAWLDAARWQDEKWAKVFEMLLPEAQAHVAKELSLPEPRSLAFAPNTHELVQRLLSCLGPKPRIVTTDGEFHSLARQLARLEEEGLARDRSACPPSPSTPSPSAWWRPPPARGPTSSPSRTSSSTRASWCRELERVVAALPKEALVLRRRVPRLLRRADGPRPRWGAAPSTSPGATSTPWPERARASSTCRRASSSARATPAGSRPSARWPSGGTGRVPYAPFGGAFFGRDLRRHAAVPAERGDALAEAGAARPRGAPARTRTRLQRRFVAGL